MLINQKANNEHDNIQIQPPVKFGAKDITALFAKKYKMSSLFLAHNLHLLLICCPVVGRRLSWLSAGNDRQAVS